MRPGNTYAKRIRENACSSQHKRQYEDILYSGRETINNRAERLYTQIVILKANSVQTFNARNMQKERHNQIVFRTV